jgi:hypothetical protein
MLRKFLRESMGFLMESIRNRRESIGFLMKFLRKSMGVLMKSIGNLRELHRNP